MLKPSILSSAAALYAGLAYIVGILMFGLVLKWPEDIGAQFQLITDQQTLLHWLYIFIYQLWAIALLLLGNALTGLLTAASESLKKLIFSLTLIWATLIAASGMLSNIGVQAALELAQTNPSQALELWQVISVITNALGGGNEYIGGFWMLAISIGMKQSSDFSSKLAILGFFVAALGIVSALPGLADCGLLFGLSQIIWFLWLGISLLSMKQKLTLAT